MSSIAVGEPELRYERKFVTSDLTTQEVELLVKLHPMMFVEKYPSRFVNSIYFDSFDLASYEESISGLSDRRKIRIRWYGELFGAIEEPALELKSKEGMVYRKTRFPVSPFTLERNLQLQPVQQAIRNSQIPDRLKLQVASLEPTLLNRYRRRYFESTAGRYRLTVDSEMEFYELKFGQGNLLVKSVDHVTTIVELKYGLAGEGDQRPLCNCLPFRLAKSSKYVFGVSRLHF